MLIIIVMEHNLERIKPEKKQYIYFCDGEEQTIDIINYNNENYVIGTNNNIYRFGGNNSNETLGYYNEETQSIKFDNDDKEYTFKKF